MGGWAKAGKEGLETGRERVRGRQKGRWKAQGRGAGGQHVTASDAGTPRVGSLRKALRSDWDLDRQFFCRSKG